LTASGSCCCCCCCCCTLGFSLTLLGPPTLLLNTTGDESCTPWWFRQQKAVKHGSAEAWDTMLLLVWGKAEVRQNIKLRLQRAGMHYCLAVQCQHVVCQTNRSALSALHCTLERAFKCRQMQIQSMSVCACVRTHDNMHVMQEFIPAFTYIMALLVLQLVVSLAQALDLVI